MKFDLSDAFIGAVSETLVGLTAWFGTFWTAVTLAFASLLAGEMIEHGRINPPILDWVATRPDIVALAWALPGVLSWTGLIVGLIRQAVCIWTWSGVCMALSGLMIATSIGDVSKNPWVIAAVWSVWTILVAGVVATLWFLRQWQINRWAGELAMLKAENSARRAEIEDELGTDSTGADEIGLE